MTHALSIETILGKAIVTLIAALMLVAAAGSASAHHGWSEYDANKRATITGTIRELHFGNPHVTIVLETPDKTWNVMLASPARLQSRGVMEQMLATGQSVTIEGLPHKTKENEFRAERMILGGTTIELR
jgi:hypothetical protein